MVAIVFHQFLLFGRNGVQPLVMFIFYHFCEAAFVATALVVFRSITTLHLHLRVSLSKSPKSITELALSLYSFHSSFVSHVHDILMSVDLSAKSRYFILFALFRSFLFP